RGGLGRGNRPYLAIFRFSASKTSAVESSSHAPSRASGHQSRGAAQIFLSAAASIEWKRKRQIIKRRPGSRTFANRKASGNIVSEWRRQEFATVTLSCGCDGKVT